MVNLTPQQKKRLIGHFPELSTYFTLQEIKDKKPEADAFLMAFINKLNTIKGEKGDKGDMPVKGKDYFTNTEINQLISHVVKQATPIKGVHYKDGKNGDNYILTQKDKKEIATQIPAVEKIIERIEVIREVMPKNIDVSMIKGAITIKELEIERKNVLDGMARVDGRIKLIDQRWGGHGGGLKSVSTDSTLTGNGTPSSPLHVVGGSGGGSGITPISPTSGNIDGSNTSFVFATLPEVIVSDGGSYRQNEGWTWNAGTSTATMSIAPTYDVYALGGVTPNSPTSGTVNGSTTAFVFTNLPQVIISDGGTYRQGFGWTWNSSTNTATMSIAPTYDLFSF